MHPNCPLPVTAHTQIVALCGALIGLEGRVIFFAFRQYIKLQPPWDWISVTVALFGFAAVCLAHMLGALGTTIDITLAGREQVRSVMHGFVCWAPPHACFPHPSHPALLPLDNLQLACLHAGSSSQISMIHK